MKTLKKKIILLGLMVAIITTGLVGAYIWYNIGFRQSAEVESLARIEIYTDESLEEQYKIDQGGMLSWGSVHPGVNTKELWIKNTGTGGDVIIQLGVDMQQLEQWGWTETWDYQGELINQGGVRKVTITLTLPDDIGVGHYEWNAGISARQA